jgi:FkbM family methyltransferase
MTFRATRVDTMGWLKSLALTLLPDRVLLRAKKLHYLRSLRRFDPAERAILRVLIAPGDHVLDLGANVGWYTKVLSELVGPSGRVYSVEPVPVSFELLRHCVRKLRLNNVTLFNCAISDRDGSAVMEVPLYSSGGENFYEARLVERAVGSGRLRRFTVALRTVDSLFTAVPAEVTFIKADVEGHELPVLVGAQGVIRGSRPAMYVEVTSDPDDLGCPAAALVDALSAEGYATYWLDGDRLVQRRPGDRSVNYFFLTENHRRALAQASIRID